MITAEEARNKAAPLIESEVNQYLPEIFAKIIEAADKGYLSEIYVFPSDILSGATNMICNTLTALGYKVDIYASRYGVELNINW